MEGLNSNNYFNYDDSWLSMPFTDKWLETYTFVKQHINTNYSKSKASKIIDEIKAVIYTLVHDGNTSEDMVLNTALLYLFVKHSEYNLDLLKDQYSNFVIDGVSFLLRTKNNVSNLNYVFDNKEYTYLNKIKLSEIIVALKFLKTNVNLEKNNLLDYASTIVDRYEGKTHRGLMKILKDTINSFNR